MNWDAIRAVGEIVGAVAVVGTLGYLALQIRHSANQSTANSELVYSSTSKSSIAGSADIPL